MNTEELAQVRERCEKALADYHQALGGMTMALESSILPKPYREPIRAAAVVAGRMHGLLEYTANLEARDEAMAAVVAAARQVHLLGACYQCDDSESGDALNDLDAAFAALDAQQAGEEHRG